MLSTISRAPLSAPSGPKSQLSDFVASDTVPHALPSAPNGPTGQLSNFVASVELEDIPEETRTSAKYLILDGIACALVGAQLPWSQTATKAIMNLEGPGNCTVIGWNQVGANVPQV